MNTKDKLISALTIIILLGSITYLLAEHTISPHQHETMESHE